MIKLIALPMLFVTTLLSASARGELIVNGDFSGGNTGFTSEYSFEAPGAGAYKFLTDPYTDNYEFASFGDHTTGTGLMMLVNGHSVPDKIIWSETVTVTPGSDYDFSYWARSAHVEAPATLRFLVNGTQVGGVLNTLSTGYWSNFATSWNSGAATSATLALYDDTWNEFGNDFVLDDFSFNEAAAVPEPSSFALVAGLIGGASWKRRRNAPRACPPSVFLPS